MHRVKLGLVAAALLLGTTALTTPAFASGNNNGPSQNCNGNGSCSTETHNYEGDTYNEGGSVGDITVKPEIHVKPEINVRPEINVKPEIYVKPEITVKPEIKAYGGDAEQYQKQKQQQKQTIKDSGNSEIKHSGNSEIKNSGNSEIRNSGNSYNKNQNDNSNSNNADQEVNVNTYNERAPVNTAYAAGLSTGEDTCMGSSSIGAQAVSFGLSIGTTWQDDNCRRLKNSRQMVALGYHRAATALMCVDADVEAAMARAGTPCPNGAVVAAAPIYYQEAPAREYAAMAPVADEPKKKRRLRKALSPK